MRLTKALASASNIGVVTFEHVEADAPLSRVGGDAGEDAAVAGVDPRDQQRAHRRLLRCCTGNLLQALPRLREYVME